MATYAEIWKTLVAVDCSDHVEKKNGLTYLSWAWAWAELMNSYPQATYEIHEEMHSPDGTVECRVTVRIDECERMMWLPVMDHRNNAIPNPDKRKISDTRMRCLVKCLAMFGLGHYIYAGEDLPESVSVELSKPITPKQVAEVNALLAETKSNLPGFLNAMKVASVEELTITTLPKAMDALQKKKARMAA
jgi:hypothetical protein